MKLLFLKKMTDSQIVGFNYVESGTITIRSELQFLNISVY